MPDRPPTCWGADRCGWSDAYRECPCADYPAEPALFDEYEQAVLNLDDHADEPVGFGCVPGYRFGLGAKGGPWPATRRPVWRDWPDTITDLPLPEETL